jgi:hypothetical protein
VHPAYCSSGDVRPVSSVVDGAAVSLGGGLGGAVPGVSNGGAEVVGTTTGGAEVVGRTTDVT